MGAPPLPPDAPYLSLASFRRDGREVRTPVWFACVNGEYCCFSAGDAGKVKRIRRSAEVRVASCSMRGEPRGPWLDGVARLVGDPARCAAIHAALRAKYGWQMRLADALARLSGRERRRAWIAVSLRA